MSETATDNERDERGGDSAATRRTFLRGVGAVAVAGAAATGFAGRVRAAAVSVPGDYPTIADAVTAAASDPSIDEVVVTEGTYSGTLSIDVADLTVRTSTPGAATITGSTSDTGPAVSIEADGVTLAGFEVTNPGQLLGVKVQAGYGGVTVRENYVHDVGPFTRLGTTGIIAGGGNNALTIAGNEVADVASEFPDDESGYPTTNGIFLDDEQSASADVAITGNLVRDLSAETAPLGILLQGNLTDVSVAGNTVTELDASNDRTPAEQEGTKFVTYAQGVNNSASSTSAVVVRRNVLTDITAEYFNGESVKIDGDASGLTVEQNDLLATVGIGNATGTAVDAPCNYWGHPQGPREVSGNLVADDGPNRQGRSAYFGPVNVPSWSVRSVENGENIDQTCVGGGDTGPGSGRGNGPGN